MAETAWLIVLIALSGFFSGSETALTAITDLKVKHLLDKKVRGSAHLYKLKSNPERMLTTLLIGNNLVNIGASAIATSLAIEAFGNAGIGIATGIMTFIVLLFGEITPKTIATRYHREISLNISWLILLLQYVLMPIVIVINKITGIMTNLFKKQGEPEVTEDDIRHLIKIGKKEGSIKKMEQEFIANVFEFDKTYVDDIMTPRVDMKIVNANKRLSDVIGFCLQTGHSRFPVIDEKVDKIVGVLYLRDILEGQRQKDDVKVSEIMREALFVPAAQRLDALLRELQKKKVHMAIIIDEHGGVAGLVTLEDLLEELVGEIFDESDKSEKLIVKLKAKEYMVSAKAEIQEVNKRLRLKIDEKNDNYDTFGGFILHHIGRIPEQGETIKMPRYNIFVTKIHDNRIKEVKVIKK